MENLLTYIYEIQLASLGIGFVLGNFVWFYAGSSYKTTITRIDVFAMVVSVVWVVSVFMPIEQNLLFNVAGLMSFGHIIWERNVKLIGDYILQLKGIKWNK